MSRYYLFGGLILITVCILEEVSSRPSNNESGAVVEVIPSNEEYDENITDDQSEERSLSYDQTYSELPNENTRDILNKIKAINDGLKKPRPHIRFQFKNEPHTGGGYILDKDILEKIQQVIASGKLHGLNAAQKQQEQSNYLVNDDAESRNSYARALQYLQPMMRNTLEAAHDNTPNVAMPFLTSIPVLVMPTSNTNSLYNPYTTNLLNEPQQQLQSLYQTRQRPPVLPFQLPWPLAPFFPILIKDPLVQYLATGNLNNIFEYGQNADVCNRKQKSSEENVIETVSEKELEATNKFQLETNIVPKSRQGRAIKKRTISKSASAQEIQGTKRIKTIFSKPVTTAKPYTKEPTQSIKSTDPNEGDLRFPFGDFTWFGNRKPVAPSPGFFINRLKVRRGGVAIAGPGGVATAGRGGAAIVGPGGLAYTQPGGLAVAGPAAKVVALSSDADLSSIVSRLHQQSATDGSVPRLLQAIPEGKVVAIGPVIYYHPT